MVRREAPTSYVHSSDPRTDLPQSTTPFRAQCLVMHKEAEGPDRTAEGAAAIAEAVEEALVHSAGTGGASTPRGGPSSASAAITRH